MPIFSATEKVSNHLGTNIIIFSLILVMKPQTPLKFKSEKQSEWYKQDQGHQTKFLILPDNLFPRTYRFEVNHV